MHSSIGAQYECYAMEVHEWMNKHVHECSKGKGVRVTAIYANEGS